MQQDLYVIVGLGVTGLSCAHYLAHQKVAFAVNDTRQVPPQLAEITRSYPEVKVSVGKLDENLGVPALDLLKTPEADLYVLELSSFQLDTTHSLHPKVATVLNVTPDHMDRYATFADYIHSKQHIYHRCQVAVCNGDDPHTN